MHDGLLLLVLDGVGDDLAVLLVLHLGVDSMNQFRTQLQSKL
jgi:hypothetical protein